MAKASYQQKIQDAIKTILGTLPVGAEFRFYWHDGAQHLSRKLLLDE